MTDALDFDGRGRTAAQAMHGDLEPPSSDMLRRLGSVATLDAALPYLPPAQPIMPIPEPEPAFDAAAMVASQKSYGKNPAYGTMPAGTADGKDAARRLREQANRKKRRGKAFGRVLLVVLLAAVGVGGYFAYTAYQDSKQDAAEEVDEVDPEANPANSADSDDAAAGQSDGASDADDAAGATPVGGLVDGLEAQDALNDTPTLRAGGFLDAIGDAREAVGGIDGEPAEAPAETPTEGPVAAVGPVLASDMTPIVLDSVSQQLSEQDGFERYIIDAAAFEAANVGAYDRFVEVVAAQPTVASGAFALLPGLQPEEIGLAVQRTGDELTRVVVVTADRSVAVDVTP